LGLIIYGCFYMGCLLLGFFGIAPIIVAPTFDDGFPYMVLVIFGYATLIGLLIHAHRLGHLKRPLFSKRKGRMKAEELELGQGKSPEEVPKESQENVGSTLQQVEKYL